MTDAPKPEFTSLEDINLGKDADPEPTLAELYAAGETISPDARFVEEKMDIEVVYRICGHTGNCPCAAGERTETVLVRTYLDDQSLYCERLDEGFATYEAMEKAVIDDCVQELDSPGF